MAQVEFGAGGEEDQDRQDHQDDDEIEYQASNHGIESAGTSTAREYFGVVTCAEAVARTQALKAVEVWLLELPCSSPAPSSSASPYYYSSSPDHPTPPSTQDPCTNNQHSSYNFWSCHDTFHASNSSSTGVCASQQQHQQPHQHAQPPPPLQHSPTMKHPLNFNPYTPPHQTAGYDYSAPPLPPNTMQEQYQPYPEHQPYMTPALPPTLPQHQPQPPQPMMMQQNHIHPMEMWYNSIPEPAVGPFTPPIPPMRGTQFLPGLHAMHPVEAQYYMYIATKRWQETPHSQTMFPNFAAMPLPALTFVERQEMNGLRECFDKGKFPDYVSNRTPSVIAAAGGAANSPHAAAAAAAPPGAVLPIEPKYCPDCGTASASPQQRFCHNCGANTAAIGVNDGNNDSNGVQAAAAAAPVLAKAPKDDPAPLRRPAEPAHPETPAQAAARREYDLSNHAWFDVFRRLYPPRRRFAPNASWSRRDCKILAILETKWEGEKWLEMAAQFCNATGRYVDPEHLKYKMESDGSPLDSDDDGDYISSGSEIDDDDDPSSSDEEQVEEAGPSSE